MLDRTTWNYHLGRSKTVKYRQFHVAQLDSLLISVVCPKQNCNVSLISSGLKPKVWNVEPRDCPLLSRCYASISRSRLLHITFDMLQILPLKCSFFFSSCNSPFLLCTLQFASFHQVLVIKQEDSLKKYSLPFLDYPLEDRHILGSAIPYAHIYAILVSINISIVSAFCMPD